MYHDSKDNKIIIIIDYSHDFFENDKILLTSRMDSQNSLSSRSYQVILRVVPLVLVVLRPAAGDYCYTYMGISVMLTWCFGCPWSRSFHSKALD